VFFDRLIISTLITGLIIRPLFITVISFVSRGSTHSVFFLFLHKQRERERSTHIHIHTEREREREREEERERERARARASERGGGERGAKRSDVNISA